VSLAVEEGQRLGPNYLTDEEYEARNDAAAEAFRQGCYQDAFARYQSLSVSLALRFLAEEGVQFKRPPEGTAPLELIVGLAYAANAELAERGGDEAPMKVATAAWLLSATAEMRMAMEKPVPLRKDAIDSKIAELMIHAQMVGQIDMLMTAVRGGWFDKLIAYETDRERKRAGAAVINARKADARQTALNEAVRITGRNPTLSNEELARKILDATSLKTTIRTATEWVRLWRKDGYLPAVKPT
jgi:hypothetical protein